MKAKALIFLTALFLTACSGGNSDTGRGDNNANGGAGDNGNANVMQAPNVTPVDNNAENIELTLTDEQIYQLSNQKWGYGQGVLLDNDNRPTGALDFNSQYSKYNATAITDNENTIFLTFDQGYENGYTSVILDVLKEKNVKATFFVIQDYVDRNPELVQRMIDEGHNIGNHSVHHYSMPDCTFDENIQEIQGLHDYMLENFNYEMTMFRPPMGEYSEKTLAITQKCGYKTILWSYAYADWDVNNQMSTEAAFNKLCNAAHSGAIYLLHSVSSTNAEVLGEFIDELKSNGYVFG